LIETLQESRKNSRELGQKKEFSGEFIQKKDLAGIYACNKRKSFGEGKRQD
jgi:hypothetical protein